MSGYALSVRAAADWSGVPEDSIRTAIASGALPAGRVGQRRLVIKRADLEAWVDSIVAAGTDAEGRS